MTISILTIKELERAELRVMWENLDFSEFNFHDLVLSDVTDKR